MPSPHSPLIFITVLLLLACLHAAVASEVGALKQSLTTIPREAAAFFSTWDAAAATPCSFTGVTCARGSVTGISVVGQGVAAESVPFAAICGSLPALATLSLPNNALAGRIDGIVACAGLRELTLAVNAFTGVVPDLSPLCA